MTRDIGEWLIYNKSSLIKDMTPFMEMMPGVDVETKVRALLKNLALQYNGASFTTEDILVAFDEDVIKKIIKMHYVREWTHE